MSKRFRQSKNFVKSVCKIKLTFGDYKNALHFSQKRKKIERKNFLKAKSMLSQGRESIVVGNAIYYWGKDKKSICSLVPDFDGIKRAIEMIKKMDAQYESNN